MSTDLPDSLARNIEQWTRNNEEALDARAPKGWARRIDHLVWTARKR